jgi:membrane-associated phospholipid phosphatase
MKRTALGFLLPTLVFLAGGSVLCLVFSREEIHMAMNAWNRPFLDPVFSVWTKLGEGWILLPGGLLLIPRNPRMFLGITFGFLLSGLLAQIFKRTLFSETARPVKYFEIHQIPFDLNTVPGADLGMWKSFPSGHTAAAFGVFFTWALFRSSKGIQASLFFLALGVAYSRIYLSQHFLMDTLGGAVLGIAGGWAAWRLAESFKAGWLDYSMLRNKQL